MSTRCWIALLAWLVGAAHAQTPVRVLLVGNSYADGTDNLLPGFFNPAAGFSLTLKSYTPGSYQLRNHLANATLLQDIRTGRYDVVVLQEQSQTPAVAYLDFLQNGGGATFPDYAQQRLDANGIDPMAGGTYFDELLENFWGGALGLASHTLTTSTARIVLFSHWARHPNDTSFLPLFPGSSGAAQASAMLDYNDRAFAGLQQAVGSRATTAGVGDAWARSYQARPALLLHDADNSHGSTAGYYLAAAVLFEVITGRSSISNSYAGGLAAADALHLRTMATLTTVRPAIVNVAVAGGGPAIALHGLAPLRYQLQSAPWPGGAWTDRGEAQTGANALLTFEAEAAPEDRYFRVLTQP